MCQQLAHAAGCLAHPRSWVGVAPWEDLGLKSARLRRRRARSTRRHSGDRRAAMEMVQRARTGPDGARRTVTSSGALDSQQTGDLTTAVGETTAHRLALVNHSKSGTGQRTAGNPREWEPLAAKTLRLVELRLQAKAGLGCERSVRGRGALAWIPRPRRAASPQLLANPRSQPPGRV